MEPTFKITADKCSQGAVKPFNKTIRARMVGGRTCLHNFEQPTDFLEQGTLKVSTLIAVEFQRGSVTTDELMHEGLGHGLCLLIR